VTRILTHLLSWLSGFLCGAWFAAASQQERAVMRHPFHDGWDDPAMDVYDDPQAMREAGTL
jgi:hypothetical protein